MQPEELVQTALTGLAAFAAQQGPDTLKSLDAVASFITDWKAPKGPLVLGLKPAKARGPLRPRQGGDARRAHHRVRLHGHLSRNEGRGRQSRREVRS